MDDRSTDREKKGKDFDFRAKVANFSAGSLKAKKLQHRMARNSKMCKNVLTPPAVSKVFQGVFTTIAKGAGDSLMSDVCSGCPHSPAGWPTIEKSFNVDTMCRRFDLSSKGVKTINSSGNRMTNGNAKPKTIKSGPDLVDKLPPPFAVGSLADKCHDIFLQSLLLEGGFSKPIFRMLTRVGELVTHFTFSKGEVYDKGIGVPISMNVSIRKVDPVSSDSSSDFRRESVKVKRGKAGNTNFRSSNAIFDIPDLRGESNILERVKESRWDPIAGANEEISFKVLEEDVNLAVARG